MEQNEQYVMSMRGAAQIEINDSLMDIFMRFNIHACVYFPSAEDRAANEHLGNVELEYNTTLPYETPNTDRHSENYEKLFKMYGETVTEESIANLDVIFTLLSNAFDQHRQAIHISPRDKEFRVFMPVDPTYGVPVTFLYGLLSKPGVTRVVAGGPRRCVDVHVRCETIDPKEKTRKTKPAYRDRMKNGHVANGSLPCRRTHKPKVRAPKHRRSQSTHVFNGDDGYLTTIQEIAEKQQQHAT